MPGSAKKKSADASTAPEPIYEKRPVVRSALTGAIVAGPFETSGDADDEADRLNREAQAGNIKHEGRPMRYEPGVVDVYDELGSAEQALEWGRDRLAIVTESTQIESLEAHVETFEKIKAEVSSNG